MAIATENEMKAKVQEMKAKVVEAESEVPKALAKALNSGKMGVMDYYNMKNLQADTAMRKALSGNTETEDNGSSSGFAGTTVRPRPKL